MAAKQTKQLLKKKLQSMASDLELMYYTPIKEGRMSKNVVEKIAKEIHAFNDKKVEIRIRQLKSRRSDQQNRYWWAITTIMSKELGYEKNEMHEILKFKFLKKEKHDENSGEIYEYIGSTAKLNKTEFADMTSELIRWAAGMNIVLPIPGEQLTIE